MIDRFERFSLTVSQISHYWHKIAGAVMERYGLKGPHAIYLMLLYRHSDGATAVELADLCARDKSDVSRAISSFEKMGLIEKKSVGGNCYRARLILTDTGIKIAKEIQIDVNKAVRSGSAGLSDEERERFYDALELICSNLRTLAEEGVFEKSPSGEKE